MKGILTHLHTARNCSLALCLEAFRCAGVLPAKKKTHRRLLQHCIRSSPNLHNPFGYYLFNYPLLSESLRGWLVCCFFALLFSSNILEADIILGQRALYILHLSLDIHNIPSGRIRPIQSCTASSIPVQASC
jgi:hypothetical protein